MFPTELCPPDPLPPEPSPPCPPVPFGGTHRLSPSEPFRHLERTLPVQYKSPASTSQNASSIKHSPCPCTTIPSCPELERHSSPSLTSSPPGFPDFSQPESHDTPVRMTAPDWHTLTQNLRELDMPCDQSNARAKHADALKGGPGVSSPRARRVRRAESRVLDKSVRAGARGRACGVRSSRTG